MFRSAGLAVVFVAFFASACTTRTFTYKVDDPNAAICQAAEWYARQNPAPGTCARIGWDIDADFADRPDEAWRFICETEPFAAELQDGFCSRVRGQSRRSRVSDTDKRQELAQLLACGRAERVMVEDLWRFGHDIYAGEETLRFEGGTVRARWRGGIPFVGWTYQEILLEAPATESGAGCRFRSDDLPGEQIRRQLQTPVN